MGIDTRTTMDMDTCIRGITLTDEELYSVFRRKKSNVKYNIKRQDFRGVLSRLVMKSRVKNVCLSGN